MIKKRGRPKEFLAKRDRLEVRLTKEQVYWLNSLVDKTGKTKTDIVMEGLKKLYDSSKG